MKFIYFKFPNTHVSYISFKFKIQKTIVQMNNIINEAKNTQNGDRLRRRNEKKSYFLKCLIKKKVKAKFLMPLIIPTFFR